MAQLAKIYIAEALIQLMQKNKLEDIRIQDLAQRAGVSRMTYYRYFQDKSDVLEWYMDHLFHEFIKMDQKHPDIEFRSLDHIMICLDFFKEYGQFALCLYQTGLEGIMLKAINRYMVEHQLNGDANSKKAFMLYAYAGAIYNSYMQWVLDGFKVETCVLAQLIHRF